MFNISTTEYSKAQRQIREKIKSKNTFTKKLSDQIAKLPQPKKKA
jgi:hypothetical protein